MWFCILSKRGSTVLPYFLFCFLVLLSLYRIQAWMNRHSQKFLCQPFKTRCFQSSKSSSLAAIQNLSFLIPMNLHLPNRACWLVSCTIEINWFHCSKPWVVSTSIFLSGFWYTCAKRSPCCVASSDVFFPLLRFIFHSDDEQYLHLYLRYDWYLHPSAWYGR